MKKLLVTIIAGLIFSGAMAQSEDEFAANLATVLETIKTNVFKNGYQYLITYDNVHNASMFVKENTDYLIFFIYDTTSSTTTDFKGTLMMPDNGLKKRYTAKPDEIGQVGVARVERLKFNTRKFSGEKEKYPVKLDATFNATMYIFYR